MPRNMSFMHTTDQVKAGTKTVTRRKGWGFLEPGTVLNACTKCRGLQTEEIERLSQIRVLSVRREPLAASAEELNGTAREGYPDMTPEEFIAKFCEDMNPCRKTERPAETMVTRIEFEYV